MRVFNITENRRKFNSSVILVGPRYRTLDAACGRLKEQERRSVDSWTAEMRQRPRDYSRRSG